MEIPVESTRFISAIIAEVGIFVILGLMVLFGINAGLFTGEMILDIATKMIEVLGVIVGGYIVVRALAGNNGGNSGGGTTTESA